MTDFSQILQREIEPIKESLDIADKNNGKVLDVKKTEKEDIKEGERNNADETEKKIEKKNFLPTAKPLVKKELKKVGRKRNPQPQTLENKIENKNESILSTEVLNPIWLTMSEAANLGGIQKKTIKRAILSHLLKYRIVENRYQVELRSVILYLLSKKKLCNKLKEHGLGQYIEKWRN